MHPFHTSAHRLKRLAPLLAAPAALLLNPGRAEAILTYNIFQSGPDVVVQTSGSLSLPGSPGGQAQCGASGLIISSSAILCTGVNDPFDIYPLTGTGPTFFDGTVNQSTSIGSGLSTFLVGGASNFFGISTYSSGSDIVSSATFSGTTLAGLGFTITSGLIGTWQLAGTPGPDGQINVELGPPATPVPGPLPLFGAAAAFGWSRRLRRRLVFARPTTAV